MPVLALAGSWPVAAVFVIAERLGKGLRVPPRDAMLSHATQEVGHGWGFGLHEALDQTGALAGPIAVAAVLFLNQGYPAAFAWLGAPAVACLAVLLFARREYPNPRELEPTQAKVTTQGFSRPFWIYLIASALLAAAFADFALIAFHFQTQSVVPPVWIPLLYALAMGADGLAALAFGRLFDRIGFTAVALGFLIGSLFAPLVFLGGISLIVVGVVLWGVGLGTQESIMRAAVASMVPADRRASGFGLFNLVFGVAWFFGSSLMGFLYDLSIVGLVVFSVVLQLTAIPIVLLIRRKSAVRETLSGRDS